jgi:hypothetical protein
MGPFFIPKMCRRLLYGTSPPPTQLGPNESTPPFPAAQTGSSRNSNRLPFGILDPKGFGILDDVPGRREATSPHGFDTGRYGFHFTGVTASGVPLFELTHPAEVRLHGEGSR